MCSFSQGPLPSLERLHNHVTWLCDATNETHPVRNRQYQFKRYYNITNECYKTYSHLLSCTDIDLHFLHLVALRGILIRDASDQYSSWSVYSRGAASRWVHANTPATLVLNVLAQPPGPSSAAACETLFPLLSLCWPRPSSRPALQAL